MKDFEALKAEIIDTKLCVGCGCCVALCPVSAITYNEQPEITGRCTSCGLCYENCPRTGFDEFLEEKRIFGRIRDISETETGVMLGIYAVKAKPQAIREKCQDGGAATALLAELLREGGNAAIVAGIDKEKIWSPVPVIAYDEITLASHAGTKYTSAPMVKGLRDAVEQGSSRIGFVGTPCQIRAIRRLESGKLGKSKLAKSCELKLGLFCMETFNYNALMGYLKEQGVDPKNVTKFEIKKGKFIAYRTGELDFEVKISKLKVLMRECCKTCTDYTSEFADISIGNIGSPDGWSTVIIRTPRGEASLINASKNGLVDVQPIQGGPGIELLKKLAEDKKKRSQFLGKQQLTDVD
jgi:coenzyme F420 hydrogenase subunit beta